MLRTAALFAALLPSNFAFAEAPKEDRLVSSWRVWGACVSLQLPPYAKVASTAEEAIAAAQGVCAGTREYLEDGLREAGADRETVRDIFAEWDERLTPQWTKQYLDLRIAASDTAAAG